MADLEQNIGPEEAVEILPPEPKKKRGRRPCNPNRRHTGKPGRPKGSRNFASPKQIMTAQQLAKQYVPAAIEGLYKIGLNEDNPAAARVAAWNSILDRGLGKAPQSLEITGADGGPIEIARAIDQELERLPPDAREQLAHILRLASRAVVDVTPTGEAGGGDEPDQLHQGVLAGS